MQDPAARAAQQAAAMAAGRVARTRNLEHKWSLLKNRYLELYEKIAHFPDSTKRMMAALKLSVNQVRKLEALTGKKLRDARHAAALAARGEVPSDSPGVVLPWNILQLFDTLAAHFEGMEGEGVGGAATPGDDRADSPIDAQPCTDASAEPSTTPPTDEPVSQGAQPQAESCKRRYVNRADPRSTWLAWRVFLAAAFGLPQETLLTDQGVETRTAGTDLPLYPGVPEYLREVPRGSAAVPPRASEDDVFRLCTGRSTWPTWQSRIVALIVGRRGGKSYVVAVIGIFLALCREYKLKLGTRGMVMILAKDKEQAGVIRNYILNFMKTPPLRGFLRGEPTQKTIELTNGLVIEVKTASPKGTRGYSVVAVLADEIAFWQTDATSATQDKEILRSLRPAMLGVLNAMVVMLSSPYAKKGELYEAHRKAFGQDDERRTLVWQADTLTMRPGDPNPEVERALLDEVIAEYDEDPDSAKAEYGAQFRDDLESLFNYQALKTVSEAGVIERGFLEKHVPYRMFVDPSGGHGDSYTAAIAHDETVGTGADSYRVSVLDKVIEHRPPFDPEEVSKNLAKEAKAYRITYATGDAYAGEWPRAALEKYGVRYVVGELNRSELYLELLPLVNSKRCRLLDPDQPNTVWKRGAHQLANLERRVGKTGKDSVDHPKGGHDDVANAAAGALVTRGPEQVIVHADMEIGVKSEVARWSFAQ